MLSADEERREVEKLAQTGDKEAVSQLLALNKRYELLVGSKTLKFTLPAIHLGPEGTRGWQEGGAPPVSDLPEDLGAPYDYHTRYIGRWSEDWWIPSEVNC